MKHIVIVPYKEGVEEIYSGIREFPTEKIILITPEKIVGKAEKAKAELERFKIPTEIETINDENSLEEMFAAVAHINAKEKGKDVLINLSSSYGMMGCTALSAAFVNGLKAFEFMNDKLVVFPILKFSYYDMLSDKKMQILNILKQGKLKSLEDLSKKVKLGPSLINYHIYGNEKNPGLKELGLIEIERDKGKVTIGLTTLGKLLLKQKEEKDYT